MANAVRAFFALSCVLSCCLATAHAQTRDPKLALAFLESAWTRHGLPKVEGSVQVGDKSVPSLAFGARKVAGNHLGVDATKKMHQGTATVFVRDGDEFIRITTNVLKDDGTRALGTPLAHNKAYEAAVRGEPFCGVVEILKAPYNTCYKPIKNETGQVIGLFYVGYKQ